MKTRKTLTLGLVLSLAGMIGLATAGPLSRQLRFAKFYANHGGSNLPIKVADRFMADLELSDEQKGRVWETIATYEPRWTELREVMQNDGLRLMEITPDDEDYDEIVAEVSRSTGATMAEMVQLGSRLRAEMHGVLTPAQKEKAATMTAELQQQIVDLLEALQPG